MNEFELVHKYIAKENSIPLVIYVHNISGNRIEFGLFSKHKPSGIIVVPEYPDNKMMDYRELVEKTNEKSYQLGLIKVASKDIAQRIRPVIISSENIKKPLVGFIRPNDTAEIDYIEIPCDIAFGNGEELEYVLQGHTVVKFEIYPSEIKPKK